MTDVPYDDEPLGPGDGDINPLDGTTFNAATGQFRAPDDEPPMFTEEQFSEVFEFFRGCVARHVVYPLGELIREENRALDRALFSIAYHSGPRTQQIQSVVRGLMRQQATEHGLVTDGGLSPYAGEIIRDFTLKAYVDAATELRRRVTQRARTSRGEARRRQAANPDELGVEEMLQSDSAYIQAVGVLLARRRGRIWWDEFQKNYYTDWLGGADDRVVDVRPLNEDIMLTIKTWIIPHSRILSKLGTLTLTEAVQHVAKRDTRNELTDWLKSLEWDGTERLKEMAKEVFGIENNDYATRAVMNMLVSAVARAFDPGCQMSSMVVIQSPQDMGKSKFIRVLAGDRWYREVTAKPGDKDFVTNMTGGWLLEIAELASLARYGTDDPVVKDAISRASDFIRPPYGRTVQEYRRSSIFIATTNDSSWHRDVTGGKRFWPIVALMVCLAWVEQHREQLWAEAVHAYRAGFEYWEVPKEAHAEALAEAAQYNPLEDDVFTRLVEGTRSGALYTGLRGNNTSPMAGTSPDGTTEAERFGSLVTLHRVGVWWMGISIENIDRKQHEVARVLMRLGWVKHRVKIDGRVHRAWVPGPEGEKLLREAAVNGVGSPGSAQWNLIPE